MCLCNTGYFECTPYLEVYCVELKESLDFDKKKTTEAAMFYRKRCF